MNRFLGSLTVELGRVAFSPEGRANGLLNLEEPTTVVHIDHQIAVIWGRLLPPWLNTGIVLLDPLALPHDGTAVIQLPGWHRRRLLTALREAGFAIGEFRTAFSMGGQIGSKAELERFRQQPSR